MNRQPINVLLADDSEFDYFITANLLIPSRTPINIEWAGQYRAAAQLMASNLHDVVLVDYEFPPGNGLDLIREATAQGGEGPFIMLTGQANGQLDFAAMEAGVVDFVSKQNLTTERLEQAIRYAAIRHRREQTRLHLERTRGAVGAAV